MPNKRLYECRWRSALHNLGVGRNNSRSLGVVAFRHLGRKFQGSLISKIKVIVFKLKLGLI